MTDVGGGGACVKGSGRCLTHDVKLVREIKNMRMSDTDKDGFTMWRLRDSSVLVCPTSTQERQSSFYSMTSQLPVIGGTSNQNSSFKNMRRKFELSVNVCQEMPVITIT